MKVPIFVLSSILLLSTLNQKGRTPVNNQRDLLGKWVLKSIISKGDTSELQFLVFYSFNKKGRYSTYFEDQFTQGVWSYADTNIVVMEQKVPHNNIDTFRIEVVRKKYLNLHNQLTNRIYKFVLYSKNDIHKGYK